MPGWTVAESIGAVPFPRIVADEELISCRNPCGRRGFRLACSLTRVDAIRFQLHTSPRAVAMTGPRFRTDRRGVFVNALVASENCKMQLVLLIVLTLPGLRDDPAPSLAGPDVIRTAQEWMHAGRAREAVGLLEQALGEASPTKTAGIINALAQAYPLAIQEAQRHNAAPETLDEYRLNLEILQTSRAGKQLETPAVPSRQETPRVAQPEIAVPPKAKPSTIERQTRPDVDLFGFDQMPAQAPEIQPNPPEAPTPRIQNAQSDPLAKLRRADDLFRSREYPEAGKIYEELATENELPASRMAAWAYCRRFVVVQRINQQPVKPEEWKQILDEVEAIRKLGPRHWYDEYLRSLVVEMSRKSGSGSRTVVRSASPETPRRK